VEPRSKGGKAVGLPGQLSRRGRPPLRGRPTRVGGTIAERGVGNSEPEYGNTSAAAMQCGDFCGFGREPAGRATVLTRQGPRLGIGARQYGAPSRDMEKAP
jgi:hypothetical protein